MFSMNFTLYVVYQWILIVLYMSICFVLEKLCYYDLFKLTHASGWDKAISITKGSHAVIVRIGKWRLISWHWHLVFTVRKNYAFSPASGWWVYGTSGLVEVRVRWSEHLVMKKKRKDMPSFHWFCSNPCVQTFQWKILILKVCLHRKV